MKNLIFTMIYIKISKKIEVDKQAIEQEKNSISEMVTNNNKKIILEANIQFFEQDSS